MNPLTFSQLGDVVIVDMDDESPEVEDAPSLKDEVTPEEHEEETVEEEEESEAQEEQEQEVSEDEDEMAEEPREGVAEEEEEEEEEETEETPEETVAGKEESETQEEQEHDVSDDEDETAEEPSEEVAEEEEETEEEVSQRTREGWECVKALDGSGKSSVERCMDVYRVWEKYRDVLDENMIERLLERAPISFLTDEEFSEFSEQCDQKVLLGLMWQNTRLCGRQRDDAILKLSTAKSEILGLRDKLNCKVAGLPTRNNTLTKNTHSPSLNRNGHIRLSEFAHNADCREAVEVYGEADA